MMEVMWLGSKRAESSCEGRCGRYVKLIRIARLSSKIKAARGGGPELGPKRWTVSCVPTNGDGPA